MGDTFRRGPQAPGSLAKDLADSRDFLCARCEGNFDVGHSPRCPVRKVLAQVYGLAQALKAEAQKRPPTQRRFMMDTADELEELAEKSGVTLYMSLWDRHGSRPNRRRDRPPAKP